MDNGNPRTAPRAFYPDYVQWTPPVARTPGWDPGPERRSDRGRALRRVLGWSSIALAALGLAVPRGRGHTARLVGSLLLIAGVAAAEALQRHQRRWAREYGFGSGSG
jgi:hypothetical protein